jgi:hypothetical protein
MATVKRPGRWISLHTEFFSRPRIIELRRVFGLAGPAAFLAVVLECEKTPLGRSTDTVEAHYAAFGELLGVSAEQVRDIVEKAAELGLVAIEHHRDPVTGREFDRVRLIERPKWAPRGRYIASSQPARVPADDRVIGALTTAGRPVRGRALAEMLGLVYGGSLRGRLSRLRREGQIVGGSDGYRIP